MDVVWRMVRSEVLDKFCGNRKKHQIQRLRNPYYFANRVALRMGL